MLTRPLATARQTLAAVVTVCLTFGPGFAAPGAAQSPSPELGHGSIRGTLYETDGTTALAGAMVMAINVRTGKQYGSELTMKNGDYLVDGLPAGTYDLAVVVGGNLFVVDNVTDLSPNESVARSFAVQPQRPANRSLARMQKPKGSATPVGGSPSAPASSNFWKTPGGIVLISVLGAGAVALIVNNTGHNDRGSPSAP